MLEIALTGNIASGKSTVARVWQSLGAVVVEADELARQAVAPGSPGLARVVERWGPDILTPAGELDRAAMRDIVFRDAEQRRALEAIVHPEVGRLRLQAFRRAEAEGHALAVADIPLLFETGLERDFDVVVFVDASEAVRRERIVETRGLAPDEADRMIAAQLPAGPKREASDIVIENTGTLADLTARAREVWADLAARAAARGGS